MDYIDAFNLDVDEESKEDETPFEPVFQLEAWKELMPHVGFTNWKQFAKCPLSKKLELALEKNVGRHAHLIINDTVYKCNVLVLRVFCELFANCLKINQVVQFPKDTLTNESFEVAYAWMTGIDEALCPNDGQQLLDVLKAAEILRCPLLCKSVFEALNDYNNFFELTAFDCFVAAISRGFFQVAHMMLRRVGKCFLVVVGSYQFQEMHANFLCNLLGSNTLAVQSEIETFGRK
ncbi:uncharacterized protein LOC108089330 isoform X2 [Drosophila ficusphila]|uniref:uncharacterized protein LOC108089330 isoform X2 n=1 Tax=Drosophila ficusphila TaxID=30025 RepID=UPI0007E837C8|nr:uncharacterized protein LOC108089330 isoform X2 [Drosophila ficusphila]